MDLTKAIANERAKLQRQREAAKTTEQLVEALERMQAAANAPQQERKK